MTIKKSCPNCDRYLGEAEPPCAQGVRLVVVNCPNCGYNALEEEDA